MLVSLSIRDVVLIERLDLHFEAGLSVLTGETGAGKSILLDALGLALGARGDAGMIRAGAERLAVSAAFAPSAAHPAWAMLAEQGLDAAANEPLVLRRVLSRDGRGKAFINDQPVGVALLRGLGDLLVEVHGQFEAQGLLNPATHRALLDAFGVSPGLLSATAAAHAAWGEAKQAKAAASGRLARAKAEEEFLRHACDEMAALAPVPGEEETLAERRRVLQHGGRLIEAIEAAQAELGRAEAPLSAAARALERARDAAGEAMFAAVLEGIERARIEADEALAQLAPLAADIDLDPAQADAIEERLFALRALARKHGVAVDGLPALAAEMAARLQALDDGASVLAKLARAEAQAHRAYAEAARALSQARAAAAGALDAQVAAELPPLKLEKARFVTEVAADPANAAAHGIDAVRFLISTNPGTPPGPLAKIASGGELARFMLALKVVLAHADPVPTLVFDEVDAGIGGATAAAVGERLGRLAREAQVLVVTHSPQVAAQGAQHLKVKKDGADAVATTVEPLSAAARLEEIARMLAGATLTEEARQAAAALLHGSRR
ncbi:DNA repair protein RecN [Oleispirillum naphthae]|uniref:DNA repair protein RecN n=1 Tax=Oleispirillum naphthae TaxID=2838853 RepID=UPI00308266A1